MRTAVKWSGLSVNTLRKQDDTAMHLSVFVAIFGVFGVYVVFGVFGGNPRHGCI